MGSSYTNIENVDNRPGRGDGYETPTGNRGIRLEGMPSLTMEERDLLADISKEGTEEFRRAARTAMRIRDLIRFEKIRMLNENGK